MSLTDDSQNETEIRNLLRSLMFRNRVPLALRATDAIVSHFGQITDWTEIEHSPARFLYESLAPLAQAGQSLQYDDIAKTVLDMPVLYYRAQAFDYRTRHWDLMHQPFNQFVAQAKAQGLVWRCFEGDESAGDGRILLARLLQTESHS